MIWELEQLVPLPPKVLSMVAIWPFKNTNQPNLAFLKQFKKIVYFKALFWKNL